MALVLLPPTDIFQPEHDDDEVNAIPSHQVEGEENILPSQVTTIDADEISISFNPCGAATVVKLVIDKRPGCGGTTWPAGRVLSEYLVRRGRAHFQGKRLLELGSGTGLVGIAAAKLGAERVYVTDQKPLLPIMEANVALNDVQLNTHVLELDWGTPLPIQEPMDIILAADCVYFEPAYPLLIQTLCDLRTTSPNAEFLFCYRQRRRADKRIFLPLLKKHFTWKEVDDDPNKEIYSKKAVVLYRLTARSTNYKTA